MTRIAVVGAGYIGREHARAIQAHPDAELALVVGTTRSAEAVARLAAETGAAASTDYAAALADPSIDVLYLCTPNRLHADQAGAGLEACQHGFFGTPLVHHLAACY